MSKTRIYFNIFISLLFVIFGIYILTSSNDKTILFDIPFRIIIGLLSIIVNSALTVKWLFILKTK